MTAREQRQVGLGGWGRCLTGFEVLANTLLSGGLGSGSENRGWPPQWPGEEKGSRNHRLGINGDRHFHTATRIPTATSPQALVEQKGSRVCSRRLLEPFVDAGALLGGALHGRLPHPRRPRHAARGEERRQRTQPPKLSRISQAFAVKLEPGRRHKPQQRRK